MKPKAVIWPFRFNKFSGSSWEPRMQWVSKALQELGYEVQQHPRFNCDLPGTAPYDKSYDCDVAIYNHTVLSKIRGDVIRSKRTWIFKPTVPDKLHTTLDPLGYGAYSSIAYEKPPYESVSKKEVDKFFDTEVKEWAANNSSKWGKIFKPSSIVENDYYLVLGQTLHDFTVEGMHFGAYVISLMAVIKELLRVSDGRKVVVKLHPYLDKKLPKESELADLLEARIKKLSKDVVVYKGFLSAHSFFPKCKCAVVCNSGVGIEAMMHHKPIISWGYPEYHWVTYDLRHLCGLDRALDLSWFDVEHSDKFLYWYLKKYCFWNYDSALRRVKELLKLPEQKQHVVQRQSMLDL